ncbi:MAG: DUF805 domain-containing protein [Cellulomonadaceae bacterium]|nr:DUF805 domain-containing protein [Cellulomonadaceae bacterium]
MNFKTAIGSGFTNFFNFHGRASRSEFWYWFLFAFIANAVLNGIGLAGGLGSFLFLALAVPSAAVAVRRLHDTGRSAFHLLFGLIPVAGPFILLATLAQETNSDGNRFGPNELGYYSVDGYQSQQFLPSVAHQDFDMANTNLAQPVAVSVTPETSSEMEDWDQEFKDLGGEA